MKNIKEKPIELQYKLYMDIVKHNIKETKSRMKRLPEMERVSKMSLEEWCKFQGVIF